MTTPTTAPTDSDSPFLPIEFQLPNNPNEMKDHISERHRLIADQVNIREVALYEPSTGSFPLKTLTGQRWWGIDSSLTITNQRKRYSYRSVVDFGDLPDTAPKSVLHGISVAPSSAGLLGTIFTRIYGTATHPTNTHPAIKAIPIPFVNSATPGDDVELRVTDTSVVIETTTASFAGFINCYVVLEYFLEGSI